MIGLCLVTLLFAEVILLIAYRRGEKWTVWTLALAGLALFAVKIWGTLAIYAHGLFGGLTVQLEGPLLLWLAALGLCWPDLRKRSQPS